MVKMAIKKAKKVIKKKVIKKKPAKKKPAVKKKMSKKNVVKKATKKKTAVKKTNSSSKKMSKLIKSNKKLATSNKKMTQKVAKQNISQNKEIAKLKSEIQKLKKTGKDKKNTRRVGEYNLFIRKQILSGLTFEKAVKEWNKYKALETKNVRKPTAYNQFIGSQMRLGKTFTQAVALWKLAKAGKLGKKGSTKTVEKVKYKTRTIKSEPEIKYRTKVKTVVKKVASKPKVITKIKYRTKEVPKIKEKVVQKDVDYDRIRAMLISSLNMSKTSNVQETSKSISISDIKQAVSADEEEIAFKLVQTYFIEIARFGLKKQLTLDEIINAYIYALAKVKRYESLHLSDSVRNAGLKK